MNERELRKRKINEKYVLTPGHFLISVCGIRDIHGKIPNEVEINRLSHKEVVYLVSLTGAKPSAKSITLERVMKGEIILVRYRRSEIRVYDKPTYHMSHAEFLEMSAPRMRVNTTLSKKLFTEQKSTEAKVRTLGTLTP